MAGFWLDHVWLVVVPLEAEMKDPTVEVRQFSIEGGGRMYADRRLRSLAERVEYFAHFLSLEHPNLVPRSFIP